jgi:polysaccharide export outer membrane protein
MPKAVQIRRLARNTLAILGWIGLAAPGCQPLAQRSNAVWETPPPEAHAAAAPCSNGLHRTPVPIEKNMMTLPEYVIEPPDILSIEAIKLVPKPPYKIEPLDTLQVNATGTRPDQPISGNFTVDTGGSLNLGAPYGWIHVSGMTLEQATRAVEDTLRRSLASPQVSITLFATAGQQQIAGGHLVGPDGTVNLGTYGKVYITGMTVAQARQAIEAHLTQFLDSPKIAVRIFAYNSKVYYVISEGAGNGDSVASFPITGNETVLDAVVRINGLSQYTNKKIWISRPAPDGLSCDQILPVDWHEIVQGGSTATNYQILPGDRVFIAEAPMLAINNVLQKLTGPVSAVFRTRGSSAPSPGSGLFQAGLALR